MAIHSQIGLSELQKTGTVQILSTNSRLPAYPLDLASGQGHVAELSSALAKFGATTGTAIAPPPPVALTVPLTR